MLTQPINPHKYKIDGCFVDKDWQFAFIHIYKNASISMRNILGMRGRYYKWEDVKDKGLIKLCVIRNPIDRLISAYLYLLRLEDNGFPEKHPTHLTEKTDFYLYQEDPIKSFHLFLLDLDGRNFYDAVTYPQVNFLADRGLTIFDIDEIFIQENIEKDFAKFQEKYGIEGNFPTDNFGDEKKKKIIQEYIETNPHIEDKIKYLYSEDFKLYDQANEL